MGLQPVKTSSTSSIPIFQTMLETAQGGFSLADGSLTAGDTIKAGTPIGYDESTRLATVVKQATMQAAATNTATDYLVEKGHHFKVGDYIASADGGAAYAITAIDTTEDDYDTITVGTTLGVAQDAGDVLFLSSATGASAAAYGTSARGLLYEDVIVADDAEVAVVIRGTVYERRIPAVSDAVKTLLPNIIFSQSF